jgi:hypothetical protein
MKLVKLIMMCIILYHIEVLFVACDIPNFIQA